MGVGEGGGFGAWVINNILFVLYIMSMIVAAFNLDLQVDFLLLISLTVFQTLFVGRRFANILNSTLLYVQSLVTIHKRL